MGRDLSSVLEEEEEEEGDREAMLTNGPGPESGYRSGGAIFLLSGLRRVGCFSFRFLARKEVWAEREMRTEMFDET